MIKRLICALKGHVGGGVYVGYDIRWDQMRRECLRCRRAFLEPDTMPYLKTSALDAPRHD